MQSKRKVVDVRPGKNAELRAAIEASEQGREAMKKDALLIEAAWLADRTVASADNKARGLFDRLSARVEALRGVVWVNPEQDPEEVLRWLKRGIDPKPEWILGSR